MERDRGTEAGQAMHFGGILQFLERISGNPHFLENLEAGSGIALPQEGVST
jgi:hypothetical protein